MLPGGAGISRSLRRKTQRPLPAVMLVTWFYSYMLHSLVHVSGGCTWFPKCKYCPAASIQRGKEKTCCFLLMVLKMTILSDLLINCLPAVTTAAQHSVHLSLQDSSEMLKFSQQSLKSALYHDAVVVCICNLTNYHWSFISSQL